MFSILLLAAAAAATPTPGETKAFDTGLTPGALKTFADWTVGCDNGRACEAEGLQPEEDTDSPEEDPHSLKMIVKRAAAADARPDIYITIQTYIGDPPIAAIAAISADGRSLPIRLVPAEYGVSVRAEDSLALIDAIKPAKRLGVLDGKGKEISHASLGGLNAALLYMDDQQKRVGTTSALIRKGAGSAVPAPPAYPVIISPRVSNAPPRRPAKADIARETKLLHCETYAPTERLENTYVRLDATTTLALLNDLCGTNLYNILSYAMLIDQKGKVTHARFDAPAGGEYHAAENKPDNVAVNANWDPRMRRIITYDLFRGLADCGVSQSFAWDGKRFRLVEKAEMGDCRGGDEFITTWRAVVVTR